MPADKLIIVRIYPSRDCGDTVASRSVEFSILEKKLAKYTDCKENFVRLLKKKCAPFSSNPDAIVIKRKLKKHRNYVDLESKDDFRLFVRSLEVKNVAKLVICAKLPTRPSTISGERFQEPTMAAPCCNIRKRSNESMAKLFILEMGGLLLQTAVQHFSEATDPFSGMEIDPNDGSMAQATAQTTETTQTVQTARTTLSDTLSTTLEASITSALSKIHQVIHKDIICDNCDDNQPIVGVRFKCLDCLNFDLCAACEAKGVELLSHKNTHSMNKYVLPLDAWLRGEPDLKKYDYKLAGDKISDSLVPLLREEHPGILCDLCNNNQYIKGPRHKCKVCDDFDLCDDCAKKDVEVFDHKKWHEMMKILPSGTNLFVHRPHPSLTTATFKNDVEELENLRFKAQKYDEFHALFDESMSEGERNDLIKAFISLNCAKTSEMLDVAQEDAAEGSLEGFDEKSVGNTQETTNDHIQIRILKTSSSNLQFSLANNSSFTIGGPDVLKFEFIGEENRKCISVLCHEITPGRSRAFNFSFQNEALTIGSIFDKTLLRISTPQKAFEGEFSNNISVLKLADLKELTEKQVLKAGDDYPSKIRASFSIKSDKLSQILITNESEVSIDFDETTFQIVNCFGMSIADTTMRSKRSIKPGRSEKFNIPVNSAHLKFPFKVNMRNAQFMGHVDLSLKNLEGQMETEKISQATEDSAPPLIELSTDLEECKEKAEEFVTTIEEEVDEELSDEYEKSNPQTNQTGIRELEDKSDSETDIDIDMENEVKHTSQEPTAALEATNSFEEFKLSDKSGSNSSMIIPVLKDMSLSASEYLDAKSIIVEEKSGTSVTKEAASFKTNEGLIEEEAKTTTNDAPHIAPIKAIDETVEVDDDEDDEEEDEDDYDIVSSDMDEEFTSDYEVLSPVASHDGQV